MSAVNIKPIKFIKKGVELEVRFIDNDDHKWYKGVVQKINNFGIDDRGHYVNCVIVYDDGEIENEAIFYDVDFDGDGLDSWKFVGNISILLSFIIKNTLEIQDLKDELRYHDDKIKSIIEDALYDMEMVNETFNVDSEITTDYESDHSEESYVSNESQPIETPKSNLWMFATGVYIALTTVLIYNLYNVFV